MFLSHPVRNRADCHGIEKSPPCIRSQLLQRICLELDCQYHCNAAIADHLLSIRLDNRHVCQITSHMVRPISITSNDVKTCATCWRGIYFRRHPHLTSHQSNTVARPACSIAATWLFFSQYIDHCPYCRPWYVCPLDSRPHRMRGREQCPRLMTPLLNSKDMLSLTR